MDFGLDKVGRGGYAFEPLQIDTVRSDTLGVLRWIRTSRTVFELSSWRNRRNGAESGTLIRGASSFDPLIPMNGGSSVPRVGHGPSGGPEEISREWLQCWLLTMNAAREKRSE